ncbi:transmembrane protein 184c [Moniliophthora roreri]|nr:transmembrane protein 184c [Moniliophthora roreri]
MARECPDINKTETDQSSFWDSGKLNWDAHRIGWTVAGVCSVIAATPAEVTQSPLSNGKFIPIIPWLKSAVTLSAFLLLLIEYVAATASNRDAKNALARKDKRKLPMPVGPTFCRVSAPDFIIIISCVVGDIDQQNIAASITGIICEKLGVLCEAAGFDAHWANVYIEAIDFVSISIALYGLLLFYGLTKEELSGRRPLAKFLAIKLIVMFTFYQSFVFSALEGKVIKATEFWTESNISNGLNALAICIEMIFFSALMWWAYNVREYKTPGGKPTSIWKPLWDSPNFAGAFGIASGSHYSKPSTRMAAGGSNGSSEYAPARARMSYDEDIRLAPYHYGDASTHNESTDESSIGRAH